jgi:hypothetical protein
MDVRKRVGVFRVVTGPSHILAVDEYTVKRPDERPCRFMVRVVYVCVCWDVVTGCAK